MQGRDYERPPYPMTWTRKHDKGRVFYTAMGHREDVWENPKFQGLVVAGLNALVFETTFGQRAAALPVGVDTPVALKVIAVVSFLSWFGVLWAGRMLPFVGAGVVAGL